MTDPLRAQLTALVAEMRERTLPPEVESDTEYWADRLAALLREPPIGLSENVMVGPREPPAAAPLDIDDLMSAMDALYKHANGYRADFKRPNRLRLVIATWLQGDVTRATATQLREVVAAFQEWQETPDMVPSERLLDALSDLCESQAARAAAPEEK